MNCGDIDQVMALFHFGCGAVAALCFVGVVALIWAACKSS